MTNQTTQLTRADLGPVGLAWVRESLESGRALSKQILQGLDAVAGRVYAFVPPDSVEAAQTKSALADGIFRSPELTGISCAEAIRLARSTGANLVVVEGDTLSTETRNIQQKHNRTFFVGADVYFWQEFQVGDASDLGSFIMMFGAGYPTNAFALNLDPISLGPAQQISSERLAALAARTRAVIVSAFDDESYDAPRKTGAIHLDSVVGEVLSFTRADGTHGTFNLSIRVFTY